MDIGLMSGFPFKDFKAYNYNAFLQEPGSYMVSGMLKLCHDILV
jgi:hypothetical protein